MSETDLTRIVHPDTLSSIIQKTISEEDEEGVFISTSPQGSTTTKACAMIRYPKVKITGASNAKDLGGVSGVLGVGCEEWVVRSEGEEWSVKVWSLTLCIALKGYPPPLCATAHSSQRGTLFRPGHPSEKCWP